MVLKIDPKTFQVLSIPLLLTNAPSPVLTFCHETLSRCCPATLELTLYPKQEIPPAIACQAVELTDCLAIPNCHLFFKLKLVESNVKPENANCITVSHVRKF